MGAREMGGLRDCRDQSPNVQTSNPWTCSISKRTSPVYQKSLSSLKILGEDSRAGQIAVSPDERRVYYVMHGNIGS